MTKPRTKSHEPITVWPLAMSGQSETIPRVKTEDVEVVQFSIPGGQTIPPYKAQGQVILHCLEGRILVRLQEDRWKLSAGQLLYMRAAELFSIKAEEDASLLATIIATKQGPSVELIGN